MKCPAILLLTLVLSGSPDRLTASDYFDRPRFSDSGAGWWRKCDAQSVLILNTQDGGSHWTDVSPPALATAVKRVAPEYREVALGELATIEALDAHRAWVAILVPGNREVRLEFTADDGRHWSDKTVPIAADDVCLSFLDEQRGFLLALSDPAAGQMAKKVYGTGDGGRNWTELSVPKAVSYYPTGISFRSSLDGWITASYHGGDLVPVYRTRDGGKTWQSQTLDLPADYRGGYVDAFPPVFIGSDKTQGYLPVKLVRHDPKSGHIAWLNYETDDAGETWHLPTSGFVSVPD